MKLTNDWTEVSAVSTMGCSDERVLARKSDNGDSALVAFWAYDSVKILEITGIESVTTDADESVFADATDELGGCFDVAICVDGSTIVAIDSADDIVMGDGYSVVDSSWYDDTELREEDAELAEIFGL